MFEYADEAGVFLPICLPVYLVPTHTCYTSVSISIVFLRRQAAVDFKTKLPTFLPATSETVFSLTFFCG